MVVAFTCSEPRPTLGSATTGNSRPLLAKRCAKQGQVQFGLRGAQLRGDAVFHCAAPVWRRVMLSNADMPIAQTDVAIDAMPPL